MQTPDILKSELLGQEELLWHGQPDPSSLLAPYDIVLIPVSLLWSAIAYQWGSSLLDFFGPARASITLCAACLPMALAGFYLLLGRYAFKAFKKRRTFYAVTNLRVLALERVFRQRTTSGFFKALPSITRVQGTHGRCSLVFGALHFPGAYLLNSGLDLFPKGASGTVNFFDLAAPEADTVQSLVDGRRTGNP